MKGQKLLLILLHCRWRRKKSLTGLIPEFFSRKVIIWLDCLEIISQGQNKHSSLFWYTNSDNDSFWTPATVVNSKGLIRVGSSMKNITITLTDKHSSLFCLIISDEEKTLDSIDTQIFSPEVIIMLDFLEIICQGKNKHSSLFWYTNCDKESFWTLATSR